jgi:cytochrome c oxidase accessory protein FixG
MSVEASSPPSAPERVLPTLNKDGSRLWLRPKLSKGPYWRRRLIVAWTLIILFTVIPYLKLNGKPLILLDVVGRRFTLFGTTFHPTDTALLMLFLLAIFVGIFLLTAILGRVWCGWACPQTVYMEFVYRPLERWIEGPRARQLKMDREGPTGRRLVKNVLFLIVSMFLGHTFLAYFVGIDRLARWVTGSPLEHPAAFLVMAATTGLMFVDFGWFREQVCLVACPYGRLQSVLLDRRSLIVGYDPQRGEPRAPWKGRTPEAGDCIDCSACVITCPTGIDIRDGLQMECIHCTQCMDACDGVMRKIGKPTGLVRYGSRAEFEGQPRKILRPRVVLYPALLIVILSALGWALAHRSPADVTVLRGLGAPYAILPDGSVSGPIRVKVVNRSGGDRTYTVSISRPEGLVLIAPANPFRLQEGKSETSGMFVNASAEEFRDGLLDIRVRVEDDEGFVKEIPYRLLGPGGGGSS